MDLNEIVLEKVNWIHLAQDRNWCRALLNTVMNLGFNKCGEFLDYFSYYKLLKKDSAR
jgi:hypothetical protein